MINSKNIRFSFKKSAYFSLYFKNISSHIKKKTISPIVQNLYNYTIVDE